MATFISLPLASISSSEQSYSIRVQRVRLGLVGGPKARTPHHILLILHQPDHLLFQAPNPRFHCWHTGGGLLFGIHIRHQHTSSPPSTHSPMAKVQLPDPSLVDVPVELPADGINPASQPQVGAMAIHVGPQGQEHSSLPGGVSVEHHTSYRS